MNDQKMSRVVFRFLLASLVGYVAMVILITIAQEVIFDSVGYYKSNLTELAIAGLLTTLSAVVGGAIGALIQRRPWYPPALAICGLIVLETTYMTMAGRLDGPLWFDVGAAVSLIVGLLLGAFSVSKVFGKTQPLQLNQTDHKPSEAN